ncbi:hypothetical protein GCM10028778_18090 [Barrientosiimonas marina]|uniref:DnaD domain-containing protein n=1 Tax=Lentibacillus kimchii TaxID=1542911 RepID=A0ABW2UXW3_9BACI
MNYIKELNAFYDQMVFNPLSGSAQAVWHALMHFNNKSGWQASFTVPATMLEFISGVKGTTFKRARTELIEKDYIDVTPGSGNQAATYRMISQIKIFTAYTDAACQDPYDPTSTPKHASHNAPQTPPDHLDSIPATQPVATESVTGQTENRDADHPHNDKPDNPAAAHPDTIRPSEGYPSDQTPGHTYDHNPVRNPDHYVAHRTDHNTAPLVKQYLYKTQTKQNPTITTATDFYQQHFGIATPYIAQDIERWISDMGDPLVLDAMRRALEQNKLSWGYVKGILKSWQTKGIRTVEEATADDHQFRNRHSQLSSSHRPGKAEVIPEWFQERKQKQAMQQQQAANHTNSHYSQAEWEECERLLAKYSHKKRTADV